MLTIRPTAALRHLRQRKLLRPRLEFLGHEWTDVGALVSELLSGGSVEVIPSQSSLAEALKRQGMVTTVEDGGLEGAAPELPFAFVRVVNFELTYGCNLACSHCLQDGLRPANPDAWIDTNAAILALRDCWFLGLATLGVNFTGGEVFLPGSPLLALVEETRSLGLQVRINTNAWWGNREGFRVGERRFASTAEMVAWLRLSGVAILALSLDYRYVQYPTLGERVISVIRECEEVGQPYELVATGASESLLQSAWKRLVEDAGVQPHHMSTLSMDTVDIGAAAGPRGRTLDVASLAALPADSPCRGNGFHRPYYLHIAPDGGVRSCLYAPGAGYLGNIREERMMEILERAAANPVARLFRGEQLSAFSATYVKPWADMYRNISHPCAASALLARIAEEVDQLRRRSGIEPTNEEMRVAHERVAKELRLEGAHEIR